MNGRLGWRWVVAGFAVLALGITFVRYETRAPSSKPVPATAGEPTGPLSLKIAAASRGARVVPGNVVRLDVEVGGVAVARWSQGGGDTPGARVVAFVDRAPVAPGADVRYGKGVVPGDGNVVHVGGLGRAKHHLTVVLRGVDGKRLGAVEDSIDATTRGPEVVATAPPRVPEGDPVPVSISVNGFRLVKADGKKTPGAGHLHLVIDAPLPPLDSPIPTDADNIVHTTERTVPLTGLAAGEHRVWVVAGDGTHTPSGYYVADLVVFTVTH